MLRLHRALGDILPASVRDWTGLAGLQIRRVLLDILRHQQGPEGTAANVRTGGLGGPDDASSPRREPAVNTAGPATLAEWTEFHELIERLPAELQDVFHQHYYYGLSEAETAEVLGVSVETVKRRWRAAKIGLAKALGGHPPGV